LAIIAVNLSSYDVTSAALSKSGKVLFRENFSIENLEGSSVSLLIQKQIKKILKTFEHHPIQIKSVGISVPGIYYSKSGTVWAPNIPGWNEYPLKQDMLKMVEYNVLAKIASRRTCDILGEKWLGAARKSKNAIYFSVGSGIGAGVLIDGRILHGFNDGVGAVGWMTANCQFKEEFRSKGTLEHLSSSKGILNSVREMILKGDKARILNNKDIQHLTIEDVFKAYELKDPIALKVINNCIELWGITVANLISLLNPEIIVFGGALFGSAIKFIDRIKSEAEKWAHPLFFEKVKFVRSELGADAALFGAGHLAMKKF
jgi:glucokinase